MPQRTQIPTRLQQEDTVFTLGGVALSMRHCVILFLGGCLALSWWHRTTGWFAGLGMLGLGLHLALAALPVLLALLVALTRWRGRTLEAWAVVLLGYWWSPKCSRWHPIQFPEGGAR